MCSMCLGNPIEITGQCVENWLLILPTFVEAKINEMPPVPVPPQLPPLQSSPAVRIMPVHHLMPAQQPFGQPQIPTMPPHMMVQRPMPTQVARYWNLPVQAHITSMYQPQMMHQGPTVPFFAPHSAGLPIAPSK
jgi:hypothetical protein